ncbi:trypco2 family protein [Streptomyces sp. NPDC016845]|uniref:trypco2 family protein n=1 Tax=Streptomyces sp. NPDC016845 TaxID=3364972 RepID=UPI0037B0BAD8
MSDRPWVGLAEAVAAVRAELQRAAEEGAGQNLHFRTGAVELEFTVDVRTDAEGRIRVLVLPWTAEAKAAHASGSVHRLKVVLQPVDDQGRDAEISSSLAQRPR